MFPINLWLQGYTLADEEEDPLIYQHRMLRSGQGDALASGPVETGPMKKLHVSTINLQKVNPLFQGTGKGELCSSHLLKTFSCLNQPKTGPGVFSRNLDTMNLDHLSFYRYLNCSFVLNREKVENEMSFCAPLEYEW